MTRFILYIFSAIFILSACNDTNRTKPEKINSNSSWTNSEQKWIYSMCHTSLGRLYKEKELDSICNCSVGNIQKEFPDYSETKNPDNQQRIIELMFSCAPGALDVLGETMWTDSTKAELMDECEEEFKKDFGPKAKLICACCMEFIIQKYSSIDDFSEKASEESIDSLIQRCSKDL